MGCPPPGVLGASEGRGWGVGHARYHVGGAAGCRRAGADGIVGVAPNVELKLVSNGGRIEFQSKLLGLPCRVHQPPLSPSSYRPGRRHEPTTLIMPTAAAPTRAPSWAPSASSGGAARPRWGAWWPQLDQWLSAGAGSPLSAGGGGIAGHPGRRDGARFLPRRPSRRFPPPRPPWRRRPRCGRSCPPPAAEGATAATPSAPLRLAAPHLGHPPARSLFPPRRPAPPRPAPFHSARRLPRPDAPSPGRPPRTPPPALPGRPHAASPTGGFLSPFH